MGAKDYSLILKALLDSSTLDKQVNALSKKYNLNLTIKVDETQVKSITDKINKIANSQRSGIKIVDSTREIHSLDDIQKRIDQLKSEGKNVQTTSSVIDGNKVGEVIKYRDALDKTVTETYKLADATKRTSGEFTQVERTVNGSTKSLSTWTDGIVNSISRTLQYATSIGLVYGALNQMKQGLEYIVNLNKEMTNIQVLQVDGAKSAEQIKSLALSYNSLAKEMGATTIEVAQGSTEWLRQGKTIDETGQLLRSTLMLSKLGALDTADATDYLTSTLNSYKLGAEDASSVVDKLIAVD